MWEKIKSILTTTKYQVRIGLAVVLIFLGGYNLFFIGDDEGHGDNISIKIESGMSTEEIAQGNWYHQIKLFLQHLYEYIAYLELHFL